MADGTPDLDTLTIRIATPADVDEVMAIAIQASEENGFLSADPSRMLQEIWPALNQDHGLIGAIGQPGGQIEGVVLLRIGAMWYAPIDKPVVEEKAIFVHPEFRQAKGGRARRLCEFSKRVADELDLPLIIGVLSHERTKGKVRMYSRVFGEPAGAFFLYNARTGQAVGDIGTSEAPEV